MKLRKKPLAIAIIGILGSSSVYAIPETEDNNTFANRNVLTEGIWLYEGELSVGTPIAPSGDNIFDIFAPDFHFTSDDDGGPSGLTSGDVDYFNLDLNPGDYVEIIVNNTPNDFSGPNPDTVLGVFDEFGDLIETNDDSSPIGDGLADAIYGAYVQPSGTLDFAISGFYDFDFDGLLDNEPSPIQHNEIGDYDVGIYVNRSIFENEDWLFDGGEFGGGEGMIQGDVDFASFTGLTPGDLFSVELFTTPYTLTPPLDELPGPGDDFLAEEPDSLSWTGGMIGLFDDSGALLAADRGWDGQTRIVGVVPTSGNLNIAITGAADGGSFGDGEAFDGISFSQESGLYDLVLETFTIGDGSDITDIVVLPDPIDPDADLPLVCGGVTECFVFGDLQVTDGEIVNLDPDVAVGYTYTIHSGPGSFTSVTLPTVGADSDYTITVGGIDYGVSAGDLFNFAPGVLTFDVSDIDPGEFLDPLNPLAFVTSVTFSQGGTYNVTQIASTQFIADPSAVPEPATLALLGMGLAGIGFAGKRRKKK